jgi:hypothetical protein
MVLPHFLRFLAMFGLPFHFAAADSGCAVHFMGA